MDLLEWDNHRGIQKLVADLNHLVQREPALHQLDFDGQGFEWIDCLNGSESTISYLRKAKDPNDFLVVACNFTPVVRRYRMGLPRAGFYREVFNSDSSFYSGSNVGNYPVSSRKRISRSTVDRTRWRSTSHHWAFPSSNQNKRRECLLGDGSPQ